VSYLSKKEAKRVSKLIAQKLEAMGVKDETNFIGSGKIRQFHKKDDKGKIIMDGGKPKLFDVEMPIAINVLRRTVRELRNSHPDVINAFLSMETPAQG
jgi:hypothetical protein